jgi:hypothetical protein
MGHLLHGSARTTAARRRALPQHHESLAMRAEGAHLHPKAVATGPQRMPRHDAPRGPQPPRSPIVALEPAALRRALRQPTRLPLDDWLSALQAPFPQLPRAARPGCLTRHGLNRLPEMTGDTPQQKKFKAHPIGSCPIAIAEVRPEAGQLQWCVALDRTSRFADAEWHDQANTAGAAQFLCHQLAAVPYQLHPRLTATGLQCPPASTFSTPSALSSRACAGNMASSSD